MSVGHAILWLIVFLVLYAVVYVFMQLFTPLRIDNQGGRYAIVLLTFEALVAAGVMVGLSALL